MVSTLITSCSESLRKSQGEVLFLGNPSTQMPIFVVISGWKLVTFRDQLYLNPIRPNSR